LRPVAGDSGQAEAVKVVTRAHKTLIWERTRHLLRLRHALREFFPAALIAFDDLAAVDALELLAAAPDPVSAAAVSIERITAALKRARRHNRAAKAEAIAAALRAEYLGQPAVVTAAYAALVRAQVAILTVLATEIKTMEAQVETYFGQHPDAEVYLSQPGLGAVLGARVLAEFGDDKNRYADARARKNYAGTSPITRQSGKRKLVLAATCTTTGSSTPSASKPSPPCAPRQAPAPTTTNCAPAASATTPRYANSATASSASSTAASKPAPATTRTPPGRRPATINNWLLDKKFHGMSSHTSHPRTTGPQGSAERTGPRPRAVA
jgi:hypothetical protein